MSERKVLNKYFPPDFDPAKIPRRKLKDNIQQQIITLVAPFSMRCNSCGEYIYRGKKFNARKETAEGEDYMGIKIFRFYIKCTLCSTEITFKTDPKNADYICEQGASRNVESWRDDTDAHASASYVPGAGKDDEDEEGKEKREAEQDAMKVLESSMESSKREIDILDVLQDIRTRNARQERAAGSVLMTPAHLAARLTQAELARLEEAEEDEALVRAVFPRLPDPTYAPEPSSSSAAAAVDVKGKGKGRAMPVNDDDDDKAADAADAGGEPDASTSSAPKPPKTLSIKRKLDDDTGNEPSLATLLAQKGLAPPGSAGRAAASGGSGLAFGGAAGSKKKKVGRGGLGVPGLVVKKKPAAK